MKTSRLLQELVKALQCLPGVGAKSAQRMAFQLLLRNRFAGLHLAEILEKSMNEIGHCEKCRTFSELKICDICSNAERVESSQLCVIETPADLYAIEQTGQFSGCYFVLMGQLSPLDGIGPNEIGLDKLDQYLTENKWNEIIVATRPTIEGEVTASFIAEMGKKHSILVTRIAHGIPIGGDLDTIDGTTLSHSLLGRQKITFRGE